MEWARRERPVTGEKLPGSKRQADPSAALGMTKGKSDVGGKTERDKRGLRPSDGGHAEGGPYKKRRVWGVLFLEWQYVGHKCPTP